MILWIVASAAFAFYVASFCSYNETYGALGGVIVFLTWLWITNIAVLFGAELNAELERGRQIEGGMDADREPFLEPRDTRKMEDNDFLRRVSPPRSSGIAGGSKDASTRSSTSRRRQRLLTRGDPGRSSSRWAPTW